MRVTKSDKHPNLTLIDARGLDSLDEYDYSYLPQNLVLFVYWYQTGSYEGSGAAVFWDGKRFGSASLGHCSCFGPCENNSFGCEHSSIEELRKNTYSDSDYEDLINELERLVKLSYGYGLPSPNKEGYEGF